MGNQNWTKDKIELQYNQHSPYHIDHIEKDRPRNIYKLISYFNL